jgi:FkbM family methyltransferase
MTFFNTIKRPFSKLAYSLFSHAPASWERKFAILMDVLSSNACLMRKMSPMASDFLAMPDLEKTFPGLDAESLATLRRFVAKLHFLTGSPHLYSAPPPYALLWGGLCTQAEFNEAMANEKRLEELRVRYHLRSAEVSSLIYHHGLRFLPETTLVSLQDTVFIDAGAYQGDSTLVFLQYKPRLVWAFEPSPPNQKMFRATMRDNHVPDTSVRLSPLGLSDKPATIRFSPTASGSCSLASKGRCKAELVPLDSLTPPTRIGLIKADLEGMGMSMLRGAVQTIQRDKPVLALSFYHNIDEFLNTYSFIRNLGVPYEYRVLSLCPPWENFELTLLAWPRN